MSENALLRLLAEAHPGKSQADLLDLLATVPDKPEKALQKPAGARSGSRPRTDASMERRRSWAASGRMPPRLACRFTLAEQAVLAVVASEISKCGHPPFENRAGGVLPYSMPAVSSRMTSSAPSPARRFLCRATSCRVSRC